MSTRVGQRGLTETPFIQDLLQGKLTPLLKRVKRDTSLDLEIRQDYLNIYYRGGNLLRVSKDHKGVGYSAFFDTKYGPSIKSTLPGKLIEKETDAEAWLARIPLLKDTMDLWFGSNRKDERAAQQMVVYENNVGPSAGGSDYFIIDIEYDNHIGARFDLVALKWDSNATARKLQGNYRPKVTAVEMKTGDGALNGSAGLLEHYRQWEAFFDDPAQGQAFKAEMLRVFAQKRQLGLIPGLKNNHNEVKTVEADVDVVFLLANHDPASRKLLAAVDGIQEKMKAKPPKFNIRFATATFMGFGLYSQNILSLEDFRAQLERIAKTSA